LLAGLSAQAGTGEGLSSHIASIRQELLRAPDATLLLNTTRYVMVNDRLEDLTTRKAAKREGRYIKTITPARIGWSVKAYTLSGVCILDATSLDPMGNVLSGPCTYYDGAGTMRATGQYEHGIKGGTWKRYDDRGNELPEKTYYAEDWDAMQVRVGLSTISPTLEQEGDIAKF
jgi:hypothetical protein